MMIAAAQMLFLGMLVATLVWLTYLAWISHGHE
jgi:hypothetical protein